MAQSDRIYKLAFRKHFTNHEANYPISQPISLGDYGTFQNGYFVRVGNIKALGVSFNPLPDQAPTQEEFQSSGSVSVHNLAKGQIGSNGQPVVNATIEIGFSSENAVYFSSALVRYNQMDNIPAIGTQILQLHKQDKWQKRHCVITRVISAEQAIVVISGSSNSGVTIEAQSPAVTQINLSDASVKLQFTKSNKVSYKIISDGESQLGFGLSRVYNPIFNQPIFKNRDHNLHLFAGLDESNKVDTQNLAFGDVLPDSYEI